MKKFIIPLLAVVTVVSIILAGCAPATPPIETPPPEAPEAPPETPTPPEAPELPPPPQEFQELIVFVSDRDGDLEIYAMSPDGSNVVKLTDNTAKDNTPSLSPDGKKIAFDSDRDGDREIYVMNSDGSNVVKLTNNSIVDLQPSWSPDGKKIAFRSGESVMATGIYVMNADGTNRICLAEPHAFISNRAWSPDGSEIVFSLVIDGEGEIYVMNSADGSNKRRLIEPAYSDNEKMLDGAPAWSPVGGKMVFYSFRHGFEGGTTITGEIFGMDEDGSNLTRLTHDPANLDIDPSWSPDGEKIVFDSKRDGDLEIYIMDSDGSNVVKLTDNTTSDDSPSWALVPIPPEAPEEPPEAPTALPKPGEWMVQTGLDKFMLAFTVSPDSTGITEIRYSLGPAFECGDYTIIGAETTVEEPTPWPITGGQFTIDLVDLMTAAPFDLGMVIEGQFDETGTQASGTWEISADGTTCQEGTWEASAP